MSDNEDLLSYEIGEIDVHDDDDDDLDAVEDQLLMSDDETTTPTTLEESLLLNDDKLIPNRKQLQQEIIVSAPDSDKEQISPTSDAADSNKSTTAEDSSSIKKSLPIVEKGSKKRTLRRNIVPTTVNLQTPPKQAKNTESETNQQPLTPQSSNNGPLNESLDKKSTLSPNSILTEVIKVAEPVTPPKSNKNQSQDTGSLSELESPVASLIFSQSGDNATTSQDESCSCVEDSENESTSLTQPSQTTSSVPNSQDESVKTEDFDSDYGQKADIEFDDSDECSERLNAKLCVERDVNQEPQNNQQRPPFYTNQRGGMSPRGGIGPRPTQNFPHQFNSFTQRPNNLQFPPRFGPPIEQNRNLMMAPPQNPQIGQRMDFRGRPPLNFRPPYLNNQPRPAGRMHFTQHGHAVNRPNFQPTGPPNNPPQFPPFINNGQPTGQMMGHFEPNGPMIYPPRPPFGCATSPFVVQAQHETTGPAQNSTSSGLPGIVPRKVLINPNFKGGVQAATNQLMMDTIGNPQFMSAQSDAELLRQQEAFINQNRMHIEKRRYERSPDRDRERDRSYSPPRRERRYSRERDVRRPMYDRGGRGRRAGSREPPYSDSRPFMKKRRSTSLERDKLNKIENKSTEPEDEETKKYRLEIEKQKSMREKILRDKEMRRRQAAEEKTKDDEKKPTEEPTTKLTPIIVTEKKIISLKKRTDSTPSAAVQRIIPLPKVASDTKKTDPPSVTLTMSKPVKPVLRVQTTQRLSDLEDYDEDALLADSPTPPLNPVTSSTITPSIGGGMFTNRRVVLTSSVDTAKQKLLLSTTNATMADVELTAATLATSSKPKGIFDRLDRKIAINETTKRKIQKIVISSDD